VSSELAGKGLSVDNSGTDTSESSRSDMTSKGLTAGSEPARE